MASKRTDPATAAVRRLHPMRLLLVSSDRGFCGVTSLLLERSGYTVRTTGQSAPVRLAELARAHRADVILVDEVPSRLRATRTVAALELLYPRGRPLVLCADGDALSPAVADRVGRSSPIAELSAAVERCYAAERPHAAR
jgi:CheY-like chemotaxis protein